ncbi:MAG: hypothetical protein AAF310_04685 [Myxococcota bacterium]
MLHTLLQKPSGMDAFMTLMRYYISVSQDTKIEQVQAQIAQVLGSKSQEGVMTLAEALKKIRMCSDLSVLEQWLRKAAVASSLQEVFRS